MVGAKREGSRWLSSEHPITSKASRDGSRFFGLQTGTVLGTVGLQYLEPQKTNL
jgi:hypothetical protein